MCLEDSMVDSCHRADTIVIFADGEDGSHTEEGPALAYVYYWSELCLAPQGAKRCIRNANTFGTLRHGSCWQPSRLILV
jgi:hypothetical protein